MAAVRPLVAVQGIDGEATEQVTLPAVFQAPIRSDVVHIVHTGLNKNHRQAYAVSSKAGHQTAAESWGTGRAVSRIPRVPGGGTHRAGQAAFGNMTRGGHMFAPTKVWRRWHRKIALNQKRYAVVSAIAATAVPALVQARGHKIDAVPEVPLVISDAAESVTKTKQAVAILAAVGAADDVERAAKSRRVRSGKGKLRNRRHVQRVGPLVVYANDDGIVRAFRNVPGVELAHVERLNLLRLAPGGHLGRFVIWTKSAFEALDRVFGDGETPAQGKKGYRLPRPIVANGDLSRLIQSDEVQSVVRAPRAAPRRAALKKNPLRNLGARIRLNPHAAVVRRAAIRASATPAKGRKAEDKALKKQGREFYNKLVADSDYQGEDYEVFSAWLAGGKKQ